MKKLDIRLSDKVICYDAGYRNVFGYRAAWMLQAMGHPNTYVLDGGFAKWLAERRPVEQSKREESDYAYHKSDTYLVELDEMKAIEADQSMQIIDFRAASEFNSGHIKGAKHMDAVGKLFDKSGQLMLRPAEERA